MTYKRKFAALLAVVIVVVCAALMPSHALAACNAATIDGSYGYRLNTLFGPIATQHFDPLGSFFPSAFAGQIVFDSTTTPPSISGSRVGNSGGQPQTRTFTGTYSVNSDCTGTVHQVLDNGAIRDYEIAIVQAGAEVEFADISAPDFGIVGEGVAKKAPTSCDATTIAGSYGFRFNLLFTTAPIQPKTFLHIDAFEPGALAGSIVFDSTTNPPSISGFRAGSTGGHPVSSTFVGTYSVNADCTGTVNQVFPQANNLQVRQHEIAIVHGGAEIEFANTTVTPLQGGNIFQIVGEGVAKKQ
jgi:hypothetical protein